MKAFKILYYLFLITALLYIIYSSVTHTGLVGMIEDIQLKHLGKAEKSVTDAITLIILCIPIALFSSQIKKKENTSEPKAATTASIILFTALPLIISFGIYAYLHLELINNQKRKIIHYSFDSKTPFPKEEKLFKIEALLQKEEAIVYDILKYNKKVNSEYYIPLTSELWNHTQPIQVILKVEAQGFINQGRYYNLENNSFAWGKMMMDSELIGEAPTFVVSALKNEKHLKLEEPLLMLQPKDLNPEALKRNFNNQAYFLIPILGSVFSMIFLFSGIMARKNKKGVFAQCVKQQPCLRSS